ncbi:unnamed protein product [Ambrosiozyma monospora]|uniref:Unnamed protein product n=1 Tax=Ambrosiozyma monospora TaxID=43982 RepID=A0A9W7DIG7_AMBMO|nr:unnamed protein product [Ambrosiozyma monospora]
MIYDWSFESESCATPCDPCETETYFCQSDLCSLSFAPKTITQTSPYITSTTFTIGSQYTPGFVIPPVVTTDSERYPYSYHLFYDYDCTLPCGPCSTASVQWSNTQGSYDGTTFYGIPSGDNTLVTLTSYPTSSYKSSSTKANVSASSYISLESCHSGFQF